jgi:ABC-type branched-subunit amino acid transport system substrate-binding protein
MRRSMPSLLAAVAVVATLATSCGGSRDAGGPLVVGAVYPTSGGQGSGGLEEYHGALLAADIANAHGGVGGRQVRIEEMDAEGADAAPGAVDALASRGVRFILGSYGSTISAPAAFEADRKGVLFWETGAVGYMPGTGRGKLVFRVSPSGLILGGAAIDFAVHELAPKWHRAPRTLRFAVAYVNDVYGSEVARGAIRRIHADHLHLVASVPYNPFNYDAASVVRRVAKARPDVLFVSAYLQDGVAIRREIVRQHLHLLANIGTSSSYCMPAFGRMLGRDALGVFASDKPAVEYMNLNGLAPEARSLAQEASHLYRQRYHQEMTAAALAGFSGAWALFHDVMPRATTLTAASVAAAARSIRLPPGSLPNGSGLEFGAAGTGEAGWNLRAASVIWQWVAVDKEAVVWPPKFATTPIDVSSSSSTSGSW